MIRKSAAPGPVNLRTLGERSWTYMVHGVMAALLAACADHATAPSPGNAGAPRIAAPQGGPASHVVLEEVIVTADAPSRTCAVCNYAPPSGGGGGGGDGGGTTPGDGSGGDSGDGVGTTGGVSEAERQACAAAAGVIRLFPIALKPSEQTCPRGDKNLCVDLWIADGALVWPFEGDNRTANPDAPPNASRAQIVFNPDNIHQAKVYVSSTCWAGEGSEKSCARPLPSGAFNNVKIIRQDNGDFVVEYKLTNSITRNLAPSIDGRITLRANGQGSYYSPAGSIDAFPSVKVYYWDGATRHDVYTAEETNPLALFPMAANRKWCERPPEAP